ncbi:MAG: hypothetical protein R6X20_12050 [Phycisphaerae bacterium]
MTRTTAVLLAALLLGATAPGAPAAEAESPDAAEARETFRSLFSKDVARARATPASDDDLAVAKRLLAVARDATASPEFLAILCDEAYALAARHESGKETAVAAMELVARHVPDRAEEARARLRRLRGEAAETPSEDTKDPDDTKETAEAPASPKAELDALLAEIDKKKEAGALVEAAALYREAQALARRINDRRLWDIRQAADALGRRIGLERRARDVRAMLERDPDNVSAREGLVRLYLVNLNDPKRAAEVLEGVEDSGLKKYVPAAARPVDEAPELACLELGEWYARLAERAPDYAKATMYARAKTYLARFMRLHETKDLHHVRAKMAMEKVTEALATLVPAAAQATPSEQTTKTAGGVKDGVIKPGQWVDLLPHISLDRDRVSGDWETTDSALTKTRPEKASKLMLPVILSGSYELAFTFIRKSGSGSVDVILPVGDRGVLYSLGGWKNTLHCFQEIDGKGGDANPTTIRNMPLDQGRPYNASVRVERTGDRVSLRGYLDGRLLTQWSGPVSGVSLRPEWTIPDSSRLGLMVNLLEATFRNLRLKMLSGEARLLRPPSGTAAGETPSGPFHKTGVIGNEEGGDEFEDRPDGPGLLVGFRYTTGMYGPNKIVKAVQPIFRTPAGEVNGKWRGGPSGTRERIVAREGYAVGALEGQAGARVDSLRFTFMRVRGGRLDAGDTYRSEWFGGKHAKAKRIGGSGRLVVGIHGRCGYDLDAVGLIEAVPSGR